jgi:hypothetical protein
MNRINSIILAVATLAASSHVRADVLELKNGTILNGKYVGGSAGTVRFEALGSMQVLATSDIIALTFTITGSAVAAPATTTPAPAQAAPAAAAPAPGPQSVTLPAGTLMLVRMKDSISSKNSAGTPFTTKIEYDLVVNGTKVVPAGTVIYGKVLSSTQARRARGQSTLDLRLTQIAVGGTRGAAAGAAIGAIVDGGDGAGKGAAIGATVGAVKKGETITITPGTLIEFNLTHPCTIRIGG